jgi:hypothetical protein
VDIDDGAVEICKLRLWLSMVADIEDEPTEVQPLPNIEFNIRQGNTLIGHVDKLESAIEAVDNKHTTQSTIGAFGENSVKSAVNEISEAIQKHKSAKSSEQATKWKHKANDRIRKYRDVLDEKIVKNFTNVVDGEISSGAIKRYSPFHWVIEFPRVFQDGGFDISIGNPPWDKVKAERTDFFPKYDEVFRRRSNTGKDKDTIQKELLQNPDIAKKWETYQADIGIKKEYYKKSPTYQQQRSTVDGRTLSGDQEKSTLFLERMLSVTNENGYVTQLLPGILFSGGSNKAIRYHLLENTNLKHVVGFENKGIFEGVHSSKKFAIVTFKNSGSSDGFEGVFMKRDVRFLRKVENHLIWIPRTLIENFAPEAGLFPFVTSETHRDVLTKLVKNPQLRKRSDDNWYLDLYRELDRTNDKDRFITDSTKADYPVFGGSTIYQFIYDNEEPEFWSLNENKSSNKSAKKRIREKDKKNLKTSIYEAFDGTGSQKGFVNELLQEHRGKPLQEDDVLLDCTEYRMVYRHTTGPANERSLIVAVIPKDVVCHNALTTIRPYKIQPSKEDLSNECLYTMYEDIFTKEELFVASGLLNSIPTDYLIRSKVEENINMFHILGTQVPRLTEGNKWFDFISNRAARINCYGEQFTELRSALNIKPVESEQERRKMQIELDAGAFHAYGLSEEEVEFVLNDFYKVDNPRMMTQAYFERVLEEYVSLS